MKGLTEPEPPADRFDVGHAAEQMLAELWRIQNEGWQLSPGEVQLRNDFGFPTMATIDRRARRGRARKVVEFKTARDLSEWGDFGSDEAPADYVAQVQWEMHVTGYTKQPADLLVMGPFFEHFTYHIPYDPALCMDVEEACREFYDSLRSDTPPDLDDSVPTYDCVRALNPNLEDRVVEFDAAFAGELLSVEREFKALEARYRGLKSRALDAMGTAREAVVGTHKVARRQSNGKGSISLYLNKKTAISSLKGTAA